MTREEIIKLFVAMAILSGRDFRLVVQAMNQAGVPRDLREDILFELQARVPG